MKLSDSTHPNACFALQVRTKYKHPLRLCFQTIKLPYRSTQIL